MRTNAEKYFIDHFEFIYDYFSSSLWFYLPLCGKAGDLLWLYNKGHNILGVEGVEAVVKEFLVENKIEYSVKAVMDGKGAKYTVRQNLCEYIYVVYVKREYVHPWKVLYIEKTI